jgi:hypothetical protein
VEGVFVGAAQVKRSDDLAEIAAVGETDTGRHKALQDDDADGAGNGDGGRPVLRAKTQQLGEGT